MAELALVKEGKAPRYCSFCGKNEHEINVLVAGPASIFICDECVEVCVEVIATHRRKPVVLDAQIAKAETP